MKQEQDVILLGKNPCNIPEVPFTPQIIPESTKKLSKTWKQIQPDKKAVCPVGILSHPYWITAISEIKRRSCCIMNHCLYF